jgi:hypothetical protein
MCRLINSKQKPEKFSPDILSPLKKVGDFYTNIHRYAALRKIYPEEDWSKTKFPGHSVARGYWRSLANQKNFLEALSKKYRIHLLCQKY